MRLKLNLSNDFRNTTDWHRWFAWYPVLIGEEIVFFEYIQRKFEEKPYDAWTFSRYTAEYKNAV
jgi:L-asparagine transporter-like permease